MKFVYCVSLLLLTFPGSVVHASEVTVAVASNFSGPMKEIAAVFEQESGHKVKMSFGSSGKIYAQIRNGAPFDLFFSADQAKPEALEKDGLAVAGSRFTYAIGTLALWSSDGELVDDRGGVLKQGRFRKLAIANPKLAPYGVAAMEVINALGLSDNVAGMLVQGENISQTFQFVSTGNAEVGFVALSQIMQNGSLRSGSIWIVPGELYHPIRQDMLLLNRGERSEAARGLLAFMRGDRARTIIESFGYKMPTGE
ncbi:molybdate ABC transporter substrate-binding protein [Emcibacter sp.]|uniref:molybdate ABC transporter substrate-binding protein n=1 Tax=Emcibacter sp. TaxID=1979954 RepID=UPI003A90B0D7